MKEHILKDNLVPKQMKIILKYKDYAGSLKFQNKYVFKTTNLWRQKSSNIIFITNFYQSQFLLISTSFD